MRITLLKHHLSIEISLSQENNFRKYLHLFYQYIKSSCQAQHNRHYFNSQPSLHIRHACIATFASTPLSILRPEQSLPVGTKGRPTVSRVGRWWQHDLCPAGLKTWSLLWKHNVPRRFCSLAEDFVCKDKVEDEGHFLFDCPNYTELRRDFINTIFNNEEFVEKHFTTEKCIIMMQKRQKENYPFTQTHTAS